jgi:hypothetical protein
MNQIKKISKTIKSELRISIFAALAIILGYVLKLLYPLDRKFIGKHSYLTGIPLIRQYFLFLPFLMVCFLLYQLVSIYNNSSVVKDKYTLFKFLKKVNFGYLFSNLTYLFVFYILYYQIYSPYNVVSSFKISGHVTTVLFTGIIFNNIRFICTALLAKNENLKSLYFTDIACMIIFYHNLYSSVWTVWVFHSISEAVAGLAISMLCVALITFLNIDRLMIALFDSPGKEKGRNQII